MKKLLPLLLVTLLCSAAFAQNKLDLQPNDTVRSVLEKQVGQVVELRMKSGEKLGGKVEKVGDKLVLVSALTGYEFFDAVVDLDNIAAVAVRAKK
jgi:uncharacterized protein YkvS